MEVKSIIDNVATRAESILVKNRNQLDKLGLALLEKETMDVREIRELLGMKAKAINVGEDEIETKSQEKVPEPTEE